MVPRSLWLLCLFRAFLLFVLVDFSLVQTVQTQNTSTPTNAPLTTKAQTATDKDAREKFDQNVIIIVVVIVFVFVFTVIVVILVSLADTRHPPPPRQRPASTSNVSQSGFSQIPPTGSTAGEHGPYETNVIPNVYAAGFQDEPTWWEIPDNKLKVYPNTILGSGQFGVILLGDVTKNHKETKCAIKTLKSGASEAEWRSLKNELQNMATMDHHPNIVNLIGAQTRGVFYVVVEYCANGDLHNYVKKHRTDLSWMGEKDSGTSIDYVTRLRIAFDVANGMSYMSTKGFIHRDLAARNVLLDGELRGKISDFGRSRDVRELFKPFQSSGRSRNEPVPTRWMPVETLRSQTFTTMSDVWSFGVLLWEIESGAKRPYDEQTTYREVVNKVVHEGYRLPQPAYCPDVIYTIMTDCWKIDPLERPTFSQIATNFSNLLQAHLPNLPHYSTLPPQ